MSKFTNGAQLKDTDGNVVHAHGAGFIYYDGYYYMFGENRGETERVSCYRTKDFEVWESRGVVLSTNSPFAPHFCVRTHPQLRAPEFGRGANIERPKVIYNEKTKQFVMWMHWENGIDYKEARCAIATCDKIDGQYIYRGSFNPVGQMSRDCTVFVDDDGTAYFVSAARDNADMNIYRLSEDYMSIVEQVKCLWPGQYREAPVIFKRNGKYFMLTSQCTGWNPNQGGYAVSDAIDGRWSQIRPFGGPTTFNTQPTAAISIGDIVLYVGDRWDPSDYKNSSYVILPMEFPSDDTCQLKWAKTIDFDLENRRITATAGQINEVRLRFGDRHEYLSSDGDDCIAKPLSYKDLGQLWLLESNGVDFRIRHAQSGRYLRSDGMLDDRKDEPRQKWKIEDAAMGRKLFINLENNKALCAQRRRIILADKKEMLIFGGIDIIPNF